MNINHYADLKVLQVSDSSMALYNSCPRKFEFRKLFQVDTWETTHATGTGSAGHAGLQNYVVTGDKDQAIFEMLMQYPYQFQDTPMNQRSWQSMVGTMDSSLKYWDEDMADWEIAMIEGPDGELRPAVEVPFALVLKEYPFFPDGRTIDIEYVGYIDLILYNRMLNSHAVVDIKTTTADTDKSIEFTFATQCVPYGLVLEVLLNKPFKNGFDVFYWLQYIHPIAPNNYLYEYNKTESDVQEWMMGFLQNIEAIKRGYEMQWFRRNSNGCMAYKRPCKFFDLCHMRDGGEIRKFLAASATQPQSGDKREEPWIRINLEY